ncbi:MAG: hypothetical protein ABSC08_12190, partial [Bryobacteraceae bacterium]
MVRKSRKGQSRGRAGGRAGGSGYDFQDVYVALQLAKLLTGTAPDPPQEVMWEKKAIDWNTGDGAVPTQVDDVIIQTRKATSIWIQLKESAPAATWSVSSLIKSGVALQFWREWSQKSSKRGRATMLRLVSGADVTPLRLIVDVARRARTAAELLSNEASSESQRELRQLAKHLQVAPDSADFLRFLQRLDAEQVPPAVELENWIASILAAAGDEAPALTHHLIRLVGRSKHTGSSARSSYTREELVAGLRTGGVGDETLIGIGAMRAPLFRNEAFWEEYRSQVVRDYRRLRVYGLDVTEPVFADLPTLFVPPGLRRVSADPKDRAAATTDERPSRQSLDERILAEDRTVYPNESSAATPDLMNILGTDRRFALIGGPGSGKTTTLRWLAVISAMPDEFGQSVRARCGLPSDPLVPIYVRFRQLAERYAQRGLHGVRGRTGLVADFLVAQLESGYAGSIPSRAEALQAAQEVLDSDRTFFLFDGLDEVSDEMLRARLMEAVADLMDQNKKPRVILS